MNKAAITPAKLVELLARKEKADERLTKAMNRHMVYQEPVTITDPQGNPLHRTVALVGSPADQSDEAKEQAEAEKTDLFQCIQDVKKANKALLKRAPEHFDEFGDMFREPTIVNSISTATITANSTAATKRITSAQLANLIQRELKRLSKLVLKDKTATMQEMVEKLERSEIDENDEMLVMKWMEGMRHLEHLEANPDKKYVRRSSVPIRDLVAVVKHMVNGEAKPAVKYHINTGGLVIVGDERVDESRITLKTDYTSKSFYDNLTPIDTILPVKSHFFDADQVDLEKAKKGRKRSDNEEKARSQFEGIVN